MTRDGMGDHRAEAEWHAERAKALLAELEHGPYAASAESKATAAVAHASMAHWHDARWREGSAS